jgi:hypothetical protein
VTISEAVLSKFETSVVKSRPRKCVSCLSFRLESSYPSYSSIAIWRSETCFPGHGSMVLVPCSHRIPLPERQPRRCRPLLHLSRSSDDASIRGYDSQAKAARSSLSTRSEHQNMFCWSLETFGHLRSVMCQRWPQSERGTLVGPSCCGSLCRAGGLTFG